MKVFNIFGEDSRSFPHFSTHFHLATDLCIFIFQCFLKNHKLKKIQKTLFSKIRKLSKKHGQKTQHRIPKKYAKQKIALSKKRTSLPHKKQGAKKEKGQIHGKPKKTRFTQSVLFSQCIAQRDAVCYPQ